MPLEKLDIMDDVQKKSFEFEAIRYCDQNDNEIFDLDLSDEIWPKFQALSRKDFHEILITKLGDTPVHFGREIKNLNPQDERKCGPVTVNFDDGPAGEYDLVIAADGIHSSMRTMLLGTVLQPVSTGIKCWRWTTEISGRDKPHFMLGKGKVLLVMPISANKAYVFASLTDTGNSFADDSLSLIRREFADFGGVVPTILARLDDDGPILAGSLLQMIVLDWSKGACVLTGDAAHGTLPTMAQGATMAMEDALVLAEELERQTNIAEAIEGYKTRRIPRAHWVQQQSLKRMGLSRIKSQPLLSLRHLVMKAFGPKILASGWRPLINEPF
ncbi:FAD-dependent monooxygenase [Kiloniella majae]|uniref:FAD-dependent monooxygenase n=1 Tax=Kiloniella majae TaxID=1938558 RepID=UPI000F790BCC|nr:FAD-dependent monooxygenase [Kiloniella majae]